MRSLFLKIFVILWIAQSLIFVISTALILRKHFPNPHALFDIAYNNLQSRGKESVSEFEKGGCDAFLDDAAAHNQSMTLQDSTGKLLCSASALPLPRPLTTFPSRINGDQVGQFYIWTIPVISSTGRQYLVLLSQPHKPEHHTWYQDMLHFAFPQLPVAIAVGGVTTFVLVLLFSRPLVRLRKATRQLAQGDLSTRVSRAAPQSGTIKGDEFEALAHDFNHMAERLESLVAAQQLLLRDVSHELRSPLARLSVALELAREDAAPEMSTHLNRIERETERLNQLIGQLLTLSSMEALERQDSFESVSLNNLIQEMMPDAEYEAAQQQCSVAFQASETYTIFGNYALLYRAVENVVRNAIRYTATGSVVEIHLATTQGKSGQTIVIEVSDRGPGIPEGEINAIFRPFYRVDPARSSGTGGFGVGLAITERAVKLHGGELQAFNRAGGGTTIQIRLPAHAGNTTSHHLSSY